jgi:hypothetical protein
MAEWGRYQVAHNAVLRLDFLVAAPCSLVETDSATNIVVVARRYGTTRSRPETRHLQRHTLLQVRYAVTQQSCYARAVKPADTCFRPLLPSYYLQLRSFVLFLSSLPASCTLLHVRNAYDATICKLSAYLLDVISIYSKCLHI